MLLLAPARTDFIDVLHEQHTQFNITYVGYARIAYNTDRILHKATRDRNCQNPTGHNAILT